MNDFTLSDKVLQSFVQHRIAPSDEYKSVVVSLTPRLLGIPLRVTAGSVYRVALQPPCRAGVILARVETLNRLLCIVAIQSLSSTSCAALQGVLYQFLHQTLQSGRAAPPLQIPRLHVE